MSTEGRGPPIRGLNFMLKAALNDDSNLEGEPI